jgi:V/A-type H+-transporting ATPase subunit I
MKTVKVVVPIDYDRDIQRYLTSTNDVELIDVQKKTFDLNSYDHGPRLRELGNEFEEIIDHFDVKKRAPKKTVKIDDRNFKTVLQSLESLEENVLKKLNHNIDRTSLAEKELEKNKSIIEIAKNLIPFGFSFEDLADERPYFSILVGRMENKRISRFKWNLDAITDGNYLLKESPLEANFSFIAVGYLERYQDAINRLLVAYGFEKYSIPERITGSPEKVVQRSQENIKKLKERLAELQEEAEQLIKEHGAEILAYAEQIDVEINYRKIDTILRKTSKNATFWGWISKKSMKHLQKTVNNYTEDNALIEFSSPVFEETEYPSKTSVPKAIRVYDGLVNTYGTPGYNEYNPALLIAIFYPIIFGIMFADVGHGLLFALLGVYGLTLQNKKLDPSTGFGDELKSYFKGGAWLMIASGLVSMVWGVLFGSYFGVTHYVAPNLVPEALWFSPEHGPVAYSPTTSVVTLMLELSLLVGMIHMTVGYILRLATNIRKKHFLEAIFVTGMLIIFHWTL